jgi:hypothetical protein
MIRPPSAGRRWSIVLAPAALVAAALVAIVAWPLRQTLAATQQQVVAVTRGLPDAAQVQQALARVAALRAELQAAQTARLPAVPTAPVATVPQSGRARWRLQLSEVLARHSLQLVDEERSDLDLPAAVARTLRGDATAARVSVWTLRFLGNYLDVLVALESLRAAPLPCHVLDLSLRRDGNGALLWTLVVG